MSFPKHTQKYCCLCLLKGKSNPKKCQCKISQQYDSYVKKRIYMINQSSNALIESSIVTKNNKVMNVSSPKVSYVQFQHLNYEIRWE